MLQKDCIKNLLSGLVVPVLCDDPFADEGGAYAADGIFDLRIHYRGDNGHSGRREPENDLCGPGYHRRHSSGAVVRPAGPESAAH